jgi:hypothetical protein
MSACARICSARLANFYSRALDFIRREDAARLIQVRVRVLAQMTSHGMVSKTTSVITGR